MALLLTLLTTPRPYLDVNLPAHRRKVDTGREYRLIRVARRQRRMKLLSAGKNATSRAESPIDDRPRRPTTRSVRLNAPLVIGIPPSKLWNEFVG